MKTAPTLFSGLALAPTPELARRFWHAVDVRGANECWPWTAYRSAAGYGRLHYRGNGARTVIAAHRLSYVIATGEDIAGHYVCHHCDNPPCCNPKHLFKGDAVANNRDKAAKGRVVSPSRPGEANPRSKLSAAEVTTIRSRIAAGDTNTAIAQDYGVTHSNISRIRLGKSWTT